MIEAAIIVPRIEPDGNSIQTAKSGSAGTEIPSNWVVVSNHNPDYIVRLSRQINLWRQAWYLPFRITWQWTVFPQPCRTDISCSFSDRICGIHGVIDGLCVNVPPCRSGCSVWENLGQSAELTHFWYHPTTYLWHDDHDRQEHISTDFPQQLKNTHLLESTSSVWQGPVMKSEVRLRTG